VTVDKVIAKIIWLTFLAHPANQSINQSITLFQGKFISEKK